MPLIGIDTYNIDFLILESDDPKSIILLDRSNYLSTPELPLLEITMPGFTGHIEIPYNVNGITVLNSDVLGLTEQCDYEEYADLPDGVYIIKQKVCPYNELFNKKYYLNTHYLETRFAELLLKFNNCSEDFNNKKYKELILDIDILIKSAKVEIKYCNIEKSIIKYTQALKKVDKLLKQLNCK